MTDKQANRKPKDIIKNHIEQNELHSAKNLLLQTLREEIDKEYEDSYSVDSNSYLAHYTSVETVHSIIVDEKDCLRLYDAFYFNDPTEGAYLKNEITKDYKWIGEAENDTEAFISSFVYGGERVGDNLAFWQSYGRDGLGCSIQLPKSSDFRKDFKRVSYGENDVKDIKQKCKDYFDLGNELNEKLGKEYKNNKTESFATEFWKCFDKIKFLCKSDDYKDEKESRLVVLSNEHENNEHEVKYDFKREGPYLRKYILDSRLEADKVLSSGSKVVIGPAVRKANHLCKNLEKLAREKELYGPQFTSSKIPYQKFW